MYPVINVVLLYQVSALKSENLKTTGLYAAFR